jgi:hypothetical protein
MAARLVNGLQAEKGLRLKLSQPRFAVPEHGGNKLLKLVRIGFDIVHAVKLPNKPGQAAQAFRARSENGYEGEPLTIAGDRPCQTKPHLRLNPVNDPASAT